MAVRLRACRKCSAVQYCCVAHQREHWPQHKRDCAKQAAQKAAQKGAAADKDASLRARLAEVQAPENAGRLNDHLFVQRTDE